MQEPYRTCAARAASQPPIGIHLAPRVARRPVREDSVVVACRSPIRALAAPAAAAAGPDPEAHLAAQLLAAALRAQAQAVQQRLAADWLEAAAGLRPADVQGVLEALQGRPGAPPSLEVREAWAVTKDGLEVWDVRPGYLVRSINLCETPGFNHHSLSELCGPPTACTTLAGKCRRWGRRCRRRPWRRHSQAPVRHVVVVRVRRLRAAGSPCWTMPPATPQSPRPCGEPCWWRRSKTQIQLQVKGRTQLASRPAHPSPAMSHAPQPFCGWCAAGRELPPRQQRAPCRAAPWPPPRLPRPQRPGRCTARACARTCYVRC